VIALVVLVGLLVAADRIALVVAERTAASTIQRSQHLDHTPSVSVAGFPFLTQLVAGDFHQVTVRAKDVPAGSGARALTVSAVTVVLHRVHVAGDLSSVRAESGTAAGTISYANLSKAIGTPVRYAGTSNGVGRVSVSATVSIAGRSITGTVTAGIALSGSTLTFTHPSVGAGVGQLPAAALATLTAVFGAPLPLGDLPFGVRVDGLHAGSAGVTIDLSGADLVYRR
jgi:hypothetical protein